MLLKTARNPAVNRIWSVIGSDGTRLRRTNRRTTVRQMGIATAMALAFQSVDLGASNGPITRMTRIARMAAMEAAMQHTRGSRESTTGAFSTGCGKPSFMGFSFYLPTSAFSGRRTLCDVRSNALFEPFYGTPICCLMNIVRISCRMGNVTDAPADLTFVTVFFQIVSFLAASKNSWPCQVSLIA